MSRWTPQAKVSSDYDGIDHKFDTFLDIVEDAFDHKFDTFQDIV